MLRQLEDRQLIALITAALLAAGFGLVSGLLTPRGPITSVEALVTMAAGLAIGLASGALTGSRWSLLIVPVAFIVALELARTDISGPTVEGINVDTMYGVIAFVLGRGLHWFLAILPMIAGTFIGIAVMARVSENRRGFRILGWTAATLVGAGVFALAAFIAVPATTPAIIGPDGEELLGGIAELTTVEIGGHQQAMMIRGRDTDNPVLLYLAGGPGGTDLGAIRRDVSLEQDFVVVVWEQRGAGKSYAALDPTGTLTVDNLISDTIEVTNYLRERFDEDKIYLVGNSWGTTLAVLAVQARPELFHGYVGTGQMVSQRATDILFYEDALAWAEETGEDGLMATLEENGPPPYEDVRDYEPVVQFEHDWNAYPEFDPDTEMPAILLVSEYSLMDKLNAFPAFLDTASIIYPQLQNIDFREDVLELGVPVYVILGEHEARGRAVLAQEWFAALDAPTKELIVFEGAGHRPLFEKPGEFASVMRRVLADTYPR